MEPYKIKPKVSTNEPEVLTNEPEVFNQKSKSKKLIQVKPDRFVNEVSVVCCFATMGLYQFQSTNEVATTPFTDRYLGFTSTQNAYVYSITGTCFYWID